MATVPIDFYHPFDPYDIQTQFMRQLYATLEGASIGIFESPTGTGKTLSLICGSMTWLRANAVDLNAVHVQEDHASDEPDWITEQANEQTRLDLYERRKAWNEKLAEIRELEVKNRTAVLWRSRKRQKVAEPKDEKTTSDDFLPNELSAFDNKADNDSVYSPAVLKLLKQMGQTPTDMSKADAAEGLPNTRKIFFASRTHSQLGQFSSELRRVSFPEQTLAGIGEELQPVKHIALASRKNLCINSKIAALPSEALNEACLALQDSKTPSSQKCKYLPKEDALKHDFRDAALADIKDIEDLVELGKRLSICPYYSSRLAIPSSELVTLPYQLLLNKSARESLGIDLKSNIVIIDEAHNLIDAINSIHSSVVTSAQLGMAQEALTTYMNKFEKRLNGTNKMFIDQLRVLLRSLADFISNQEKDRQLQIHELFVKGGDNINLHKVCRYLRASKLARKIDGYCQSVQAKNDESQSHKSTPVLMILQSFLECLANLSTEGRIFFRTAENGVKTLEYMLLDPSNAFSEIVAEARSIVLAGGTMEPMADFINFLFPSARDRVKLFSCGHIIPEDNLLALVLESGVSGRSFELTYQNRSDLKMLEDLGRSISNLISAISDGVVVFFSSYRYLEFVLQTWQRNGIYDILKRKKPVFREPQDTSIEEILHGYSQSIKEGKGALLFAVVGGKMSEGINFSDAMGRGIIMVGLPFPNANTVEWQTKIAYVENTTNARLLTEGRSQQDAQRLSKVAGQEYYENSAMRAVNQSIGRAIRHSNDYAAIILIDKRYGMARIQNKLPSWIRTGMCRDAQSFASTMKQTGQFFRKKRAT